MRVMSAWLMGSRMEPGVIQPLSLQPFMDAGVVRAWRSSCLSSASEVDWGMMSVWSCSFAGVVNLSRWRL